MRARVVVAATLLLIGLAPTNAGLRISGGQLASSQARVSRRNVSRSGMARFHNWTGCIDLSPRASRISICLCITHAVAGAGHANATGVSA